MPADTASVDDERESVSLLNFSMPAWCERDLDADGAVRGKTWHDMPPASKEGCHIERACNWWLWKRGLLNLRRRGLPLKLGRLAR